MKTCNLVFSSIADSSTLLSISTRRTEFPKCETLFLDFFEINFYILATHIGIFVMLVLYGLFSEVESIGFPLIIDIIFCWKIFLCQKHP